MDTAMPTAVVRSHVNLALTHLFNAIQDKDITKFRRLLKGHGDVRRESLQVSAHPDITGVGETGLTLLGLAAGLGQLEAVATLIKHGMDVCGVDHYGQTALHRAAAAGAIDVADLLLHSGAAVDLEAECQDRRATPLHVAACAGHAHTVALLIHAGAHVNNTDNKGRSALDYAVVHENEAVAIQLLQAGANPESSWLLNSPLHYAIQADQFPLIEELIRRGADVNSCGNVTGRSPIFPAVEHAQYRTVELLLASGAHTGGNDRMGFTPLTLACFHNHGTIAEQLVRRKADVNLQDSSNNLPLHHTTRRGNGVISRLLIEAGSDMNLMNKDFETPLHNAIRVGHVGIIELLLEHGADVHAHRAYTSQDALHTAISCHSQAETFTTILELLLAAGCDLESRAVSDLEAALHQAKTDRWDPDGVLQLMSAESSNAEDSHIDLKYAGQETALYRAIDHNKIGVALSLLRHGADPNAECPHDTTILHKACQRKLWSLVEVLLQLDIDWSREVWLDTDKHTCGISLHLLEDYEDNVPLALHNKLELYFAMDDLRSAYRRTPLTLMLQCRCVIRIALHGRFHQTLHTLLLPKYLRDFIIHGHAI